MTKKKSDSKPSKPFNATEFAVCKILSELLVIDEDQVTPQAKLQEDLGADSLDLVEFVMLIEDHFNVQIPDDKAEKIIAVRDAVKLIEKLTASRGIEADSVVSSL